MERLVYYLSGEKIVFKEWYIYKHLMQQAGVKFAVRPRGGHLGNKILFFLTQPLSRETKKIIFAKLTKRGIKNARLDARGKY